MLSAVSVPAEVIGRFFIVEATLDARGPFRFLVDSGSTVSLVSPRLASLAQRDETEPKLITTRTGEGDEVQLARVTLQRLTIGDATLVQLPAGVHGFEDLSHHLGERIDGVLGLSAFRGVLLTLDYPNRSLRLDPHGALDRGARDTRDAYFGAGVPLTSIRVGERQLVALIDSGSDGALALNSVSDVPLTALPRRGGLRATLAGDRPSMVSRAAGDLEIGSHVVRRPVVELTNGMPAIGGEVLAGFAVSFDQRQSLIAFTGFPRPEQAISSRRSIGLSFVRTDDHWRVATIIPETPATRREVAIGDECVLIEGEPVGAWPIDRFDEALRERDTLTLSFRAAVGVRNVPFAVVKLVP